MRRQARWLSTLWLAAEVQAVVFVEVGVVPVRWQMARSVLLEVQA
jgi:hypothetical protein